MALRISRRLWMRGRPPFFSGIYGAMTAHSLAVRSVRYVRRIMHSSVPETAPFLPFQTVSHRRNVDRLEGKATTMLMMEPDGSIVHDSPSIYGRNITPKRRLSRLVAFTANVFAIGSGQSLLRGDEGETFPAVQRSRQRSAQIRGGFEDAGLVM